MPPPTACPGVAPLRQLLQGQATQPDADQLEQHVVNCPQCLQQLAEMAGVRELVAAAPGQAAATRSVHPVLDRLRAKIAALKAAAVPPSLVNTGTGFATGVEASPASGAPDETSHCLGPPQGPGEMGRLGGYRVLRVLGVGGMGTVYEAEDPTLRRRVALKTMRPVVASQHGARERFLREARAAAALNHDRVVPIYQVGEDHGVPFLAMPLLHGEMLEGRLQRVGRLPLSEALRIARETAEGFAVAHDRGIIHRDIKPGNIWLEAPGDRVKILDFGLASGLEGDVQLTMPGAILGTPAYMAPEQAGGVVDHRADLFSLGCMLYRMATGRMPFAGSGPMEILRNIALQEPRRPRELNLEIAAPLDQFILRLLAKEREQRPVSAAVVGRVLTTLEQQIANTVAVAPPLAVPLAPGQRPATPPPVAQLAPKPSAPANPAPPIPAVPPRPVQTGPPAKQPAPPWKAPAWWLPGRSPLQKALIGGGIAAVALGVFFLVGVAVLWRGPPLPDPQTPQGPTRPGDKDKTSPLPGTPPVNVGDPLNPDSIVWRPAKITGLKTWDVISGRIATLNPTLSFLSQNGPLDIDAAGNNSKHIHFLWDFSKGSTIPDAFGGLYDAIAPNLKACALIKTGSVDLFESSTILSLAESDVTHYVAWSNGGDRIATYGNQGLRVWNAKLTTLLSAWPGEGGSGGSFPQLAWAQDDKSIVAWRPVNGDSVYQLDVADTKAKELARVQVPARIYTVRLRQQSDVIAVHCYQDKLIRLYDLKTESMLYAFSDAAEFGPLAWSPDGDLLAFNVGEGVQVWNCKSLREPVLLYTLNKPEQHSLALVFAPLSKTLISYNTDGKMRLWDMETGKLRGTIVFLIQDHWLAVTAEGHYRASEGAEEAGWFSYKAIEDKAVTAIPLTPKEFAEKYHWNNDPDIPVKAVR